ncbi:WhiB family transcriptional regulator [Streptomyces sp. N35]|uniref:WhiB family transcriptional regulator n=1 Tax=Streptomyces sp. N35 TaxID=2795730 RepID=UPI0018F34656|nr:WhiB family transcriptional regulator [Streptomyces sp. N35]
MSHLAIELPAFLATPDAEPACARVDPELFFPAVGQPARRAKLICAGCPLAEPCRSWARSNRERGVWGGESEPERRQTLRRAGYAKRKAAA